MRSRMGWGRRMRMWAASRWTINEAIGPAYSGLEEAKADVTGIFLAKWLVDQKLLPASELNGIYASYVAGIFRTLRFGTARRTGARR
jgi:hypothetical protein